MEKMDPSRFVNVRPGLSYGPVSPYPSFNLMLEYFPDMDSSLDINQQFFCASAPGCGMAMLQKNSEYALVHCFRCSGTLVSCFPPAPDETVVSLHVMSCGHILTVSTFEEQVRARVYAQTGQQILTFSLRSTPKHRSKLLQVSTNGAFVAALYEDGVVTFTQQPLQQILYRKQQLQVTQIQFTGNFQQLTVINGGDGHAVLLTKTHLYLFSFDLSQMKQFDLSTMFEVQTESPLLPYIVSESYGAVADEAKIEAIAHHSLPRILYRSVNRLKILDFYNAIYADADPRVLQQFVTEWETFRFSFCGTYPCIYVSTCGITNIKVLMSDNTVDYECFSNIVATHGEEDGLSIFADTQYQYLTRIDGAALQIYNNTTDTSKLETVTKLFLALQSKRAQPAVLTDLLKDGLLKEELGNILQYAQQQPSLDLCVPLLQIVSRFKVHLTQTENCEITQLLDAAKDSIRVRNQLIVGVNQFYSGKQFEKSDLRDQILLRLCSTGDFADACRISKFTHLKSEGQVMSRYIICKMLDENSKSVTTDELLAEIKQEVDAQSAHSSYGDVTRFLAESANEDMTERIERLVDMEPDLEARVEMYLRLKAYAKAVRVAAGSQDMMQHALHEIVRSGASLAFVTSEPPQIQYAVKQILLQVALEPDLADSPLASSELIAQVGDAAISRQLELRSGQLQQQYQKQQYTQLGMQIVSDQTLAATALKQIAAQKHPVFAPYQLAAMLCCGIVDAAVSVDFKRALSALDAVMKSKEMKPFTKQSAPLVLNYLAVKVPKADSEQVVPTLILMCEPEQATKAGYMMANGDLLKVAMRDRAKINATACKMAYSTVDEKVWADVKAGK